MIPNNVTTANPPYIMIFWSSDVFVFLDLLLIPSPNTSVFKESSSLMLSLDFLSVFWTLSPNTSSSKPSSGSGGVTGCSGFSGVGSSGLSSFSSSLYVLVITTDTILSSSTIAFPLPSIVRM